MGSLNAGREASAQLHRVRWFLHAQLLETKLRALERAVKANFDPNQPRVPAGNPDGGEWTDAGGGGSSGDQSERIRLAENDPPDHESDVPRLPRERPKTIKERNRGARVLARFILKQIRKEKLGRLIGPILDMLEVGDWVREEYSEPLQTYIDPPKSLQELHRAVFSPSPGTQIHHIVEQVPAAQDGYPISAIDASDNLVRIPIFKHEEITAWFNTSNPCFGGRRPRDYLRGKSWDERRRLGIEALIKFEVLKP